MALPKVKFGDVFEIKTSKGFGYFQCVKETSINETEVIRVFHPSLHDTKYYEKVTDALKKAGSREDALNILKDIAEQLKKGTF